MTRKFFDVDLHGLTRNQKLLLALLYRQPEMAATPEQIKAWGFSRTTVFSLGGRWLIGYAIHLKCYELSIDARVLNAAAKFARWAAAEYPEFERWAA